ncbi:alpha/beta fold hydrolase [Gammaproteobacteria bacterium]|nr:alpha/beta fold hydrolase [Gammaproteobacteria bacterium]
MIKIKPSFAVLHLIAGLLFTILGASSVFAVGEAGPISLRAQGNFFVGLELTEPAEDGSVMARNQMFVGYQLVAEPQHPYPLILIHGGGGQASDWFTTPDGRDGWRNYFLAAGFDVYWVDRPGYGRSPSTSAYGELGPGAPSSIISFLATSEHWPGDASNLTDPSVVNWLSGSMPGPYAGDEVAAADLAELLERIGPAIVITHSAGGITGWWGLDANSDNVAGLMAIEAAGSNILEENVRQGLTFAPALPEDFSTVTDSDGCALQADDAISLLPAFADKQIILVGAERGLIAALPCGLKTLQQAGAQASYVYLPDYGFEGNGHFMMADTNNGDIAQLLIEFLSQIE